MKIIVGLGNPGPQHEQTRHNVGFRVLDRFAAHHAWKWTEHRSRSILASGTIGPEKAILAKPLTFMNLSGEAVNGLMRWYKVQPEDLLIISDDLDLPVGKVRLRTRGSAGGQKGLKDILQHLHTDQIPRLRVGIGRPSNSRMDTIDYVLGIPKADEAILLHTGEDKAADAIEMIIRQGLATTMNVVNADPEAEQKAAEKRQRQKERQEQARLKREALQKEQSTSDNDADQLCNQSYIS